jgi:hypothetical protein
VILIIVIGKANASVVFVTLPLESERKVTQQPSSAVTLEGDVANVPVCSIQQFRGLIANSRDDQMINQALISSIQQRNGIHDSITTYSPADSSRDAVHTLKMKLITL